MNFLGNLIDVRSVELNTGHRLARDLRCLLLDCGGTYRELVNGEGVVQHSVVGTAPDVENGMLGRCTAFAGVGGSAGVYVFDDLKANVRISGDRAWACGFVKVRTAADYANLFGRTADNNADPGPYGNFRFELNHGGSGQGIVYAVVPSNGANGFELTNRVNAITDNVYYTLLGQASVLNGLRLYLDGVHIASGEFGIASLPSYDTNSKLMINGGNDTAADSQAGCQVFWGAVWARELDDSEIAELNALLFDDGPSALLRRPMLPAYLCAHALGGAASAIPAIMASYRRRRV